MEIQLQELIDKIKNDGVAVAESKAAEILEAAKAEADKMISDAKATAEKLMQNAKVENDRMVKSGEDAIRQAGRNVLISFRESVARELEALVGEKVGEVYSSEALSSIIIKVVEGFKAGSDAGEIAVILNDADQKALEEGILSGLKAKMLGGVTLKTGDTFDGGFRVAVKDGKVYYDYSTEAVTAMLSAYLSPKVTALLKEAENNG